MKTQIQKEKESGMARLTVLLPKDELKNLKLAAVQKGSSMMELARIAIVRYLKNLDQK